MINSKPICVNDGIQRNSGKSRRLFGAALFALVSVFGFAAQAQTADPVPDYVIAAYGHPPAAHAGEVSRDVKSALATVIADSFAQTSWDKDDRDAFTVLAASKDPRLVWTLIDLMRFTWSRPFNDALAETALSLLGVELDSVKRRAELTDHMIAWDMPTYPGYLADKRAIYTNYLDGFEAIFVEGAIKWEQVSWGGVSIDARPFGTEDNTCQCIPAADDPAVSSANDADWLDDDAIIFGIEVNGAYRAYPRQIMEVREMVNDTLGGRDLGIPYCSLCGAAQAYFTDGLPEGIERPVLRTSGLLIRSNKVMYDVNSNSVFDTFLGHAVTGPLAAQNITLEQATVITARWGDWRRAHPETTVLVEELALGRDYNLRETRDRNGPIFPIGDVDPRLPIHEDIIGVISGSGTPIAVQRSAAYLALQNGEDVVIEDLRMVLDAGGIRAETTDGAAVPSHQAYWFAWSQFHPETELWPR